MFQATTAHRCRRWVGLIVLLVGGLYLLSATVGAAASHRHVVSDCTSKSDNSAQYHDHVAQLPSDTRDSGQTELGKDANSTHPSCCGVVCHAAAATLSVPYFTDTVNEVVESIWGAERPIIRNLDRLDRPPKSRISH